MNVSDYKCISCSANLRFNPQTQKWVCDYCGASYTKKDLEKAYGTDDNLKNENEIKLDANYGCYNCPNCGAEIIMDDTTTATFCVYCGSNAIVKNKLKGEFNPSKIIPFKTTKDDAIAAFKQYKKGKLFIPNEFTNPQNIEKISGIYIPFFIYDCDVESDLHIKATRTTHWSDFSYNYTKTDYYNLHRNASTHFENIPVDGATKFPDDIMNSIEPFNYKDLQDFSPSYLSGFLSERYNVDINELFEIAKKRAIKTSEDEIISTITSYGTKTITNKNHNVKKNDTSEYVLLPVWMLNVKFNDNIYTFAMNGQTGKFVGNVPIDKKKFWKYWIGIFSGSLIITSLLVILFNLL
ncbi:MAG: DNA helicase PriA [Clostridia bacterium]|nr:DNA helicase PriA [Clostridia bacterium]